ncbi:MAG: helix-turn-helix domain-containing protein [Myxococcota bacterium]
MGKPDAPSIDDRIRAAAVRLFSERGYGATTVGDIAASAGVGIGTLYRRWPDKPALANDVYALVVETINAYQPPGPRHRSRKARFVDLLSSFSRFAKDEPEMLLFWVGQPHEAYLDRKNQRRQQQSDSHVRELMADLGLTASADVAAAMTLGTLAHCVRTGAEFDGEDLAERLWRALS